VAAAERGAAGERNKQTDYVQLTRHGVCSSMVAADVRRRNLARKTLPPSRRAKAPLRRDGGPPRYLGGYGSCDDS